MKLKAVACVAKNGVIGRAGSLPWNVPEDMARFKELTMGHALILGRKSYMGPLPGRKLVVLSRKGFSAPEGIETSHTKEEALKTALALDPKPFVIGGAEIYKLFEDEIKTFYITRLKKEYSGDVFFPFEMREDKWQLKSREEFAEGFFEIWEKKQ
ncbi:dihydrofolate reductase [bacterium]|nr:dihydrofolate reductase [bacterium]